MSEPTVAATPPSFCPVKEPKSRVLTRLFIRPDGDVIVTDLWEEVRALLMERGDFDEGD